MGDLRDVERYWNGTFGRLARKDVFLRVGEVWEVETREGGTEGRSRVWRFADEAEARGFLRRCLDSAPTDWRQLHTDPT